MAINMGEERTNYVELKGIIQKDPIVRYASSGTAWATWTMVVTQSNSKGKAYVNCKAFGELATEMEKMGKSGMYVEMKGKIATGSYTAKDGRKVFTTDVVADEVDYSKGVAPDATDMASQMQIPTGFSGLDEDIPF